MTRITLTKRRGGIHERDGSSGNKNMGDYTSDAGVGAKNGKSVERAMLGGGVDGGGEVM